MGLSQGRASCASRALWIHVAGQANRCSVFSTAANPFEDNRLERFPVPGSVPGANTEVELFLRLPSE